MTSKRCKALYVEWVDSYGCSRPWVHRDEAREAYTGVMLVKTLGWLVEESDSSVVLAHSVSEDSPNVGGLINIPKVSIKKRRVLRW